MKQCVQFYGFSNRRKRRQDKRGRQLAKLSNMRAAKERKRHERIAEGWTPEPKLVRYYPLEFGIRNKLTGEVAWTDLKSVRDADKRIGIVLKYY